MFVWWQVFITFMSNVGLWLLKKEQNKEAERAAPVEEIIEGVDTNDDSKVLDGLNKLRERRKK